MLTEPPAAPFADVSPADSERAPPAPVLPPPTDTLIAPPAPPVAAPEPIDTEPVEPELDVPELNISDPETPAVPAFALLMVTAPVDESVPWPLITARWPPVPAAPSPDKRLNSPPPAEVPLPWPPDNTTFPPA